MGMGMMSNSLVSFGIFEDLNVSEIKLPVVQLRPEHDVSELVTSIAQKGLLQPIIARTVSNKNCYEIVAGCRRFIACKKLGWRKIACQIVELSDKEAFEISIIENLQRKTLEPLDEAEAFKMYVSDNGWGGVSELAAKVGKSVAYVTKRMLLLALPPEVKTAITDHSLKPSMAEELIYVENPEDKSKLAQLIIDRHLTIKNVRKISKEMSNDDGDTEFGCRYVDPNSKANRSFDKSIVALRIAMNRIALVINDVEDDWVIHEILMQHKRRINEQIDLLIKEKKKFK
jgi:ParB family transcriptional regulator, chromosome partitioning protein